MSENMAKGGKNSKDSKADEERMSDNGGGAEDEAEEAVMKAKSKKGKKNRDKERGARPEDNDEEDEVKVVIATLKPRMIEMSEFQATPDDAPDDVPEAAAATKEEDEEDVDFGEDVEEDIVTHQVGKRPLPGKVWKNTSTGDYTKYLCMEYGAGMDYFLYFYIVLVVFYWQCAIPITIHGIGVGEGGVLHGLMVGFG